MHHTVKTKEDANTRNRERRGSVLSCSTDALASPPPLKLNCIQDHIQNTRTKQREVLVEDVKKDNQKLLKNLEPSKGALNTHLEAKNKELGERSDGFMEIAFVRLKESGTIFALFTESMEEAVESK